MRTGIKIHMDIGILSIGLSIPQHAFAENDLAELRHVDPNKYSQGLGCHNFAVAMEKEQVVEIATKAALRAIAHWKGNLSDIGLIATGTESSLDESRPLSAWVAEKIGLSGHIRSYEVKHACYGGTVAVRQAIEWIGSGAAKKGKVALVIAADICRYAPESPAEPTQGAGAVAMIIGEHPSIARFRRESFPYSQPVFDFWRPTGNDFPIVEGKVSTDKYTDALYSILKEMAEAQESYRIEDFNKICCHVPFPKMVFKAFKEACLRLNYTEEQINMFLENKIKPYMQWNKEIGNSYTASLWFCVAQALRAADEKEKILCFSYGSGCGAEALIIDKVYNHSKEAYEELEQDLKGRKFLTAEDYAKWQKNLLHQSK